MVRRYLSFEDDTNKPSLLSPEETDLDFDELYQAAQDKVEKSKTDIAPEDEPTDTSSDEDTETETPALESVVLSHQQSYQAVLALEGQFLDKTKQVGALGIRYLADAGLTYGPKAIDHIFKGVIAILEHTMKALIEGTKAIQSYVKKRLESFQRFKGQFEALKKVVDTLTEAQPKLPENASYNNERVMALLISKNDTQPNSQVFPQFFNSTVGHLKQSYHDSLKQLKLLIGQALSGSLSAPEKYLMDKPVLTGMSEGTVDGYPAPVEGMLTYRYQEVLPGNVLFIAQLPDNNIDDPELLKKMTVHSKMLMGTDTDSGAVPESINYLELSDLTSHLDSMVRLCDTGIEQMKLYGDLEKSRDALINSFKGYVRQMFGDKEQISVKNSLVDYVSAKVSFMDQTYLAGLMAIHSYTVQWLNANLDFAKANAKVLTV